MDNMTSILQLNQYPKEKYNVLVPVTTMQAASSLQRIVVSQVQLDTRQDSSNKGPSRDIYFEKSSNSFAITKVGGMKLAAAANISIVSTEPGRTEACARCIEMARATGQARSCGNCPHVYDVAVTVTIRVPEPSGGFRLMQATKEIDMTLEKASMKSENQYNRFLPHRTAIAESKAFMRAIRAALGLAGTYSLPDLQKPFIVARMVPNLEAPEIKEAVAANYLQSMGMLFEMPAGAGQIAARQDPALPAPEAKPETVGEYPDERPGDYEPGYDAPEDDGPPPWLDEPEPQDPIVPLNAPEVCADCRRPITVPEGKSWKIADIISYSRRIFGRQLCTECQNKAKAGRTRA